MAESPLIQFRLKDDAKQALQALALPGESLNICAQRLIMEMLGMSTVDRSKSKSVVVDKTVYKSTEDDETLIERLTPAIAKQVQAEIESRLGDLVNNLIDANLPAALEECLGKE